MHLKLETVLLDDLCCFAVSCISCRVLYSVFDVLCDHCNNECINAVLVVVVVAAALVVIVVVVVVVVVVGYA